MRCKKEQQTVVKSVARRATDETKAFGVRARIDQLESAGYQTVTHDNVCQDGLRPTTASQLHLYVQCPSKYKRVKITLTAQRKGAITFSCLRNE